MADENTTGSEQTPTVTTPEVTPPAPASPDTSTTENPPADSTLLTGEPPKVEDKAPEQTDEEKAAAAEHDKLFGAPETEYEITGLPEGMTIDKEALAAFEPVAKQLGLSNEGMSLVAQTYAQILPKVTEGVIDNLQKDIIAQHATWATEATEMVKSDEAFGGKPLPEVLQVSAKTIDRFGGPEFREFLDQTGLGNHPAMVKFSYLAGTAISEDTTFERGGTAPTAKSRTEKFYGPQT